MTNSGLGLLSAFAITQFHERMVPISTLEAIFADLLDITSFSSRRDHNLACLVDEFAVQETANPKCPYIRSALAKLKRPFFEFRKLHKIYLMIMTLRCHCSLRIWTSIMGFQLEPGILLSMCIIFLVHQILFDTPFVSLTPYRPKISIVHHSTILK